MWKSDSYKPKRLNRMLSSNRTRVRNNTLENYTFENYLRAKMVKTIEAKTIDNNKIRMKNGLEWI